jgi:Ca-activated chloride channel family protein
MNREQAEKLLAAMIFDDLDETSRAELLAYLQTDDELRDRLTDLRMAVKLTSDAVNDGPDPVLSEQRLKQLRQLAKTHKAGTRVFTMRRVLSVAAVMAFGLVLVGLLTPSLSRSSKQARKVSLAVEQRLRSLTDTGVTSSEVATLEMPDSEAKRLPAAQASRGRGEMGGPGGAGYDLLGGYASNGGATAMVDGAVRNGGLAVGGGIYSDTTNRLSIIRNTPYIENAGVVRNGGQGLGGAVPSSADEPPVVASAPLPTMERKRNASEPRGLEKLEEEQVAQIMSGMTGRHDMRRLPTEPTVVVSDSAPTKPSDGFQDEFRFRGGFSAAGSTPSGPEGMVQSYAWSAPPLEKPAPPARAPTATYSVASSERKTGEVREFSGGSGADADSRVPMLGDVPLVGRLFGRSGSDVKQDLRKELSEVDKQAEAPSSVAPVQMQDVRPVPDYQPADQAGVILETEEAGVPAPSHFRVVPVNPWVMTGRDALSTFALDVDTASYALCRRYIRSRTLPPIGAVRMEEFINAFDYAYPQRDGATFAVYAEGAPSPFAPEGQDLTLLKIAVKARTVGRDQRRPAHIVFVVDASASMGQADRLPLVQAALNLLVGKLSEADRVSLITCANEARLHLEAVPARQRDTIRQTIEAIQPTGPTNLMAGLELGYAVARRAFVAGQINQVVLCSDGVANVGETEAQVVLQKVAEDRKQGITLTCVGVGYGAYNDAFLETLADRGDGRYVFLDSSEQAREALVNQLAATLEIVAKDARIQVEFNPARVRRYRLIGYENRDIEDQRFRDDTVDAGEVGSGQCSTALYELELTTPSSQDGDDNLGTVFVRYRHAETGQIEEISRSLAGSIVRRRSVAEDPRFFLAVGAARFAEWLRESEHARQTTLADVQHLLNDVSAALPLDQDVQDLAELTRQAQGLPRASQP